MESASLWSLSLGSWIWNRWALRFYNRTSRGIIGFSSVQEAPFICLRKGEAKACEEAESTRFSMKVTPRTIKDRLGYKEPPRLFLNDSNKHKSNCLCISNLACSAYYNQKRKKTMWNNSIIKIIDTGKMNSLSAYYL